MDTLQTSIAEQALYLPGVLGKTAQDAELARLMSALPESPEFEEIEGELYCLFERSGLSLTLDSTGTVKVIQLYSDGYDGFCQYAGILPERLSFADGRVAVRARLGEASLSGKGGEGSLVMGVTPPYDRYDYSGYAMHIQYTEDSNAISLITLMTPQSVPDVAPCNVMK